MLGQPPQGQWQLLIIYRGLHCPICKKYLGQLNEVRADFDKMTVHIVAVSTDPEKNALTEIKPSLHHTLNSR